MSEKSARSARANPLGTLVPGVLIVRVGIGKMTHILHPKRKMHLCNSGKNAGNKKADGKDNRGTKPVEIFKTDSKYVTCYRCQKLAEMNTAEGRAPWQVRNG